MTQDVDILSTRAAEMAEQLCDFLHHRFQVAVRIRRSAQGTSFRLYQVRKPANRHLVNLRQVDHLPPCSRFREVLVLAPAELIALKVVSMAGRPKTPKGLTDAADVRRLLLAFPELKVEDGLVAHSLQIWGATDKTRNTWRDLVTQEILPEIDPED